MKAILSILFFVLFGLIGMRLSGPIVKSLLDLKTFEDPDSVARFTLIANISVAALIACIGIAIALILAPKLNRKLIRDEP